MDEIFENAHEQLDAMRMRILHALGGSKPVLVSEEEARADSPTPKEVEAVVDIAWRRGLSEAMDAWVNYYKRPGFITHKGGSLEDLESLVDAYDTLRREVGAYLNRRVDAGAPLLSLTRSLGDDALSAGDNIITQALGEDA